jgi:hypothetical protein
MATSIVPYINCTDKAFDVDKTDQYDLTIQIALGGFSIVIRSIKENCFIFLKAYQSNDWNNTQSLMDAISKALSDNGLKGSPFHSVQCIVENRENTLVPTDLFNPDDAEAYLDFVHYKQKEVRIMADKLKKAGCHNVYCLSTNIIDRLRTFYGEINFIHEASVLISKTIDFEQTLNNTAIVSVYIKNRNYDLVIVKNGKLIFYNNFKFETKEDFVYYMLFSMNEWQLDTKTIPVYFSGTIMAQSEIMSLCKRYIMDIRFMKNDENIKFSPAFNDVPLHQHYISYNI